MMNIYCNLRNKNRKSTKPKISYIFQKAYGLFITYSNCGHEYGTVFKEEESIEILKLLGLITTIGEYHKIYNHV